MRNIRRYLSRILGLNEVYEFRYNECIHESASTTISLHRTITGAQKALDIHKSIQKKEWDDHDEYQRKEYGKDYESLKCQSKFGDDEAWGIQKTPILE